MNKIERKIPVNPVNPVQCKGFPWPLWQKFILRAAVPCCGLGRDVAGESWHGSFARCVFVRVIREKAVTCVTRVTRKKRRKEQGARGKGFFLHEASRREPILEIVRFAGNDHRRYSLEFVNS
jgi:hypothetical protein